MNILGLSWRNIGIKPLSSLLSLILFALGIGMISLMLLLNKQVSDTFENNLAGVNLVVGAKGSPLQLILSSIYHIDFPTGNITLRESAFLNKHPMIKKTIPLAMGDSYKNYRIIGTNHDYQELYKGELAEGTLWEADFDVTIGANVAEKLGLKLGDQFISAHGFGEAIMEHDEHKFLVKGILKPSNTVLDKLILTNISSVWASHDHGPKTEDSKEEPHDHDHEAHAHKTHAEEKPKANSEAPQQPTAQRPNNQQPTAQRPNSQKPTADPKNLDKEITSLLVFYRNPMAAVQMPRFINDKTDMQAAAPAFEMSRLYEMMGVGELALRMLALMIVLVSGLSIFISLYNSLKERKYELAVMRVMGASRSKLFLLVVLEGLFIAVLGFVLGIAFSHIAMEGLAHYMQDAYQYSFTGWLFLPEELYLLAGALGVGFVAAVIPALRASNMDISETLARG